MYWNLYNIGMYISLGLLSFFGIKKFIQYAKLNGIVDIPNERSNHNDTIPRGAGVVIIILSLLFGLLGTFFSKGLINSEILYISLLTISICMYFFVEDVVQLRILERFLFQSIVVSIGIYILRDDIANILPILPPYIRIPLVWLAWLWFVNLYNFMDGIDGITVIQTLSIMAGVSILIIIKHYIPHESLIEKIGLDVGTIDLVNTFRSQMVYELSGPTPVIAKYHPIILDYIPIIISISISLMIFGIFNYSPAKVFIGDSGSVSLGFIMGAILIKFASEYGTLISLTITMYYAMDATIVFIKRLFARKMIWQPHSEHFFQIAKRGNVSNNKICIMIGILNICLIYISILMLLAYKTIEHQVALFCVAILVTLILLFIFAKYGKNKSFLNHLS